MNTPTDCLVLRIFDRHTMKFDSGGTNKTANIFILYDVKTCEYIVRGSNDNVKDFVPFSYSSDSIKELIVFIETFLCKKYDWSFEFYNYDNLPYKSKEITYEFLNEYLDNKYNLVSYDDDKYSKKQLKKWLRMLKHVKNDYLLNNYDYDYEHYNV